MVLIVCNSATFILALGVIIVGAFVNNEVKGWQMSPFDVVGNMCLGIGSFIAVVSILGIMAGRTNTRPLLFVYFILILLVTYLLLLAVVLAAVEGGQVETILDEHWPEVQRMLGTDMTVQEATSHVEEYLYAICGLGVGGLAVLMAALVCTVRLLGIRAIAFSCLVSLGVLGAGSIYAGVATSNEVPTITTYLMWACGGVQLLCSICGLVGFQNLNRECMRWFFIVLLGASVGLCYVIVNTYTYMRDHPTENQADLLMVFGISLVSDFFMFSTLSFAAVLYCKRKAAFKAADRAHELPVHYSQNARKYGKYGPGGGRKGRARQEYTSRNAL